MVKKIEILQDAILVGPRSELYYADCFTSLVPSHLSCLEIYYSLTANLPKWVTLLFKIRDIIVKITGVLFHESDMELIDVEEFSIRIINIGIVRRI